MQEWSAARHELKTRYLNRDFECKLVFRLANSDSPAQYANGRITFEVTLAPGAELAHLRLLFVDARSARSRAHARMQPRRRARRSLDAAAAQLARARDEAHVGQRRHLSGSTGNRSKIWEPCGFMIAIRAQRLAAGGRSSLVRGGVRSRLSHHRFANNLGPPRNRASGPFATSVALQATKDDLRATRSRARFPTSCATASWLTSRGSPRPTTAPPTRRRCI